MGVNPLLKKITEIRFIFDREKIKPGCGILFKGLTGPVHIGIVSKVHVECIEAYSVSAEGSCRREVIAAEKVGRGAVEIKLVPLEV